MPSPIYRQKFIESYTQRFTPEQLAKFLYDAKTQCERDQKRRWTERVKKVWRLEEENEILKGLLSKNGVPVYHLVVTFLQTECFECEFYQSPMGCVNEEFDFDCPKRTETKTFDFYTFMVTDALLKGITTDLKEVGLEVVSVYDSTTGRFLYNCDKEEGEP